MSATPSPLHPFTISDLKPDASHQLQRVAAPDDAGSHLVIEDYPAIFQVILEMRVCGAPVQSLDDSRQRQIVCGDDADCAALDQAFDNSFGADKAIVRIGAAQNLVEQEEQRQIALGQFDDLPQPRDLGVK